MDQPAPVTTPVLVASDAIYLRNTWYAAAWSEDIVPDRPFARTLLAEPIVFFRKADGTVAALLDRCPHRFAPLSAGTVLPGDRLQCPYHGLAFDASGACVLNPHGKGTIPAAARVAAFPVVERHSLIWIWMGQRPPTPETIPDFSCFDEAPPLHVTRRDHLVMAANYELITDNLLDLSHTSFLHDGILGNQDTVVADMTVTGDGETVTVGRASYDSAIPGLFRPLVPAGLKRVDKWNTIRWSPPGCMLIRTGVCRPGAEQSEGTGFHGIHLLTPETERTTHYLFAAVRWNVLTQGNEENARIQEHLSTTRRFAFVEQDAPIIEAQQRTLDRCGDALRPVMLSIDAGPVRYRRVLERLLRADIA